MVSRNAWESYEHFLEDLTKAGIEQSSCSKKSHKDVNDSFLQRKLNKDDEKIDGDILGYSSSEDSDEEINADFQSARKTYPSAGKRALVNRKATTNQRKRPKKHGEDCRSPVTRFAQRTFRKSTNNARMFSTSFESSFTTESPSLRSFSPATSTQLKFERKDDDVIDNITWSGSGTESESPEVLSQDKIPLSTECVKQEQENQVSGSIDDFDSESELCTKELLNKESSPSISPNTPTPNPTPCSPVKEGEGQPPLDSSKKRKQKYLRSGLAERLHRLCVQENSRKSFWSHKMREINGENEYPSASGEVTLTLRVVSESLDHDVYVIRCHVVSQDVILLSTNHVILLLESERREHLDGSLTSRYLKIYSPWKIFDLPDFSLPVLSCMAHCEVIPSSGSNIMFEESPEFEQVLTQGIRSTVAKKQIDVIPCGSNMENDEGRNKQRKEPAKARLENVVERNIQDSSGYQGICMISRVNVTARVQRIFWRSEAIRDENPNTSSTLAFSIIEDSKTMKKNERMSLCCLVQGLSGACCEVRFPENILLDKTDWQKVLFPSEGSILSFSELRVVEHRKRKRRRQLFGLIDSLKRTQNLDQISQPQSLKRLEKQQSCFIFLADGHSLLELMPEDQVSDYPSYSSPENLTLSGLKSATLNIDRRVRAYGKLLHANFTNDKYYNTKHVRLWMSGALIGEDSWGSDAMAEPAVSVIQIRYCSGRTVGWNESTLLAGQLLCVQDLVLEKAKPVILKADIFSNIQVISRQSARADYNGQSHDIHEIWHRTMSTTMTDEEYELLKSLPVARLPNLNEDSSVDTLVTFEGLIFDVDQENAFGWYSCSRCHSKDILEIQHISPQYQCKSCSLEFISPVTNTHLEVYLKCVTTPILKVKVKLCQPTISSLLSGSNQDSSEVYDVKGLLNKYLGPMYCYVVERVQDNSSKISFKLEELDSSSWSK